MTKTIRTLRFAITVLALAACSPKAEAPSEPAPAAEPAPSAPEPAPAAPPSAELPAVPAGAKVFFVAPLDGAKVEGPLENGKITVHVQMGAENITVKPAGAIEAGSGHHHILIDPQPIAVGTPVPKDEQHLHFGQGQTEATIGLEPGEHTLTLQFADGLHRSYGPALASTIKVNAIAAGSVQAAPTAAAVTPTAPK
jgi:phage baseplate assembly protein gpV